MNKVDQIQQINKTNGQRRPMFYTGCMSQFLQYNDTLSFITKLSVRRDKPPTKTLSINCIQNSRQRLMTIFMLFFSREHVQLEIYSWPKIVAQTKTALTTPLPMKCHTGYRNHSSKLHRSAHIKEFRHAALR